MKRDVGRGSTGSAKFDDPPAGLVVLDVRTLEEFDAGHIDGATMLDFYRADFADRLAELDRDTYFAVIGDLKEKINIQATAGRDEALIRSLAEKLVDLAIETGDELEFVRPGVQKRLYADLRRGQLRPEDSLFRKPS